MFEIRNPCYARLLQRWSYDLVQDDLATPYSGEGLYVMIVPSYAIPSRASVEMLKGSYVRIVSIYALLSMMKVKPIHFWC